MLGNVVILIMVGDFYDFGWVWNLMMNGCVVVDGLFFVLFVGEVWVVVGVEYFYEYLVVCI